MLIIVFYLIIKINQIFKKIYAYIIHKKHHKTKKTKKKRDLIPDNVEFFLKDLIGIEDDYTEEDFGDTTLDSLRTETAGTPAYDRALKMLQLYGQYLPGLEDMAEEKDVQSQEELLKG